MSEDTIKRKIEPICHIIANVYAIAGASFLVAGQYFNSMGTACWISAVPSNCVHDPEVECIRGGEMVFKYRRWFIGYSVYAIFLVITVNMSVIVWSVFMQKKKSDQWRFGSSGASDDDNGGRCFPCRWSIFSSRGISVVEQERGDGTSCAVIDENDKENPDHHHLAPPLEDCLQPKVSTSLTTQPKSFSIFGAEDEENGSPPLRAAPSRAGNEKDPYAFNLRKVKAKIKAEAKSVDITMLGGMPTRPKQKVQTSETSDARASVTNTCGVRSTERQHCERREVLLQCSLYIGAFFISWIFSVITR